MLMDTLDLGDKTLKPACFMTLNIDKYCTVDTGQVCIYLYIYLYIYIYTYIYLPFSKLSICVYVIHLHTHINFNLLHLQSISCLSNVLVARAARVWAILQGIGQTGCCYQHSAGVGKCPNVSHLPTIGDISSPRDI